MFQIKYINKNIAYYSDLIPELEHFFTTRGINLSDVQNYLNITSNDFIHPTQTHSSNIEFAVQNKQDYPDTDALILTNNKQGLYLRFADCTPVILYDKKSNVGAIAHAGWRGTVSGIVPKTVEKIINFTGSNITDIYAIIGPAIGICCYSVGDEVIEGIKSSVINHKHLIEYRLNRTYVNLKETNAQQLREIGVPNTNIDICPFCTSCRNDLFYSYRKESGTHKRHYAVIKLK